MNIQDLIAQCEQDALSSRKAAERVMALAQAQGRANLTADETRQVDGYLDDVASAKRKLDGLREVERSESQADANMTRTISTGVLSPQRRTTSFSIGRNERQYRQDQDPHGVQFLTDVVRQFMFNDVMANERLSRHMQEECVERPQLSDRKLAAGMQQHRAAGDTTTANWSGLVVPQYLVDMVAPATANMRPFADAATAHHDLPAQGMSVNISRVTTPTNAGLQSAELAQLPTASADDTLLTIPVQSAGGYVNVSRQAIDRGYGIDEALLQDLFNRYATDLDNQLINQASTGALAVASNIDVPSASFTPQVLYSKILGGVSSIRTALLNMGQPSHVIMSPRRWDWLSAQTTSAWPLVSNQGGNGPGAGLGEITSNAYGRGVVGRLPNGLLVVTDGNMPVNLTADSGTGEDALLVVPQTECHLWEDPNQPAFIRAEQVNAPQLGVLLVAFGYYAYSFARYPGALAKLTGSALTAPTF